MKLYALPVIFDTSDPKLSELGIETSSAEPGIIYINPEAIQLMYSTKRGETNIGINGGLITVMLSKSQICERLGIDIYLAN